MSGPKPMRPKKQFVHALPVGKETLYDAKCGANAGIGRQLELSDDPEKINCKRCLMIMKLIPPPRWADYKKAEKVFKRQL